MSHTSTSTARTAAARMTAAGDSARTTAAGDSAARTLDDPRLPVRVKLAAAWTSVMFLYAYVDIIAFFKPGVVDTILDGKVWEFDATQTLLTTIIALMAIPTFMIVLSTTLPARASRLTNLVVASVQIPYAAFNLAGGTWPFYYGLGVVLEVGLLVLILRMAATWPKAA
ncbi:DUF6326 family protein [Pedococcus dokdonensis]|nr:DUF6326 family protein [Pedococcus dokdonensis]